MGRQVELNFLCTISCNSVEFEKVDSMFICFVGKTNWREAGSERDRGDGDTEEGRSGGRWEHRGNHRNYDSSNPLHRKPWDSNHHDNHDNLPEWYYFFYNHKTIFI